MVSMAPPRVSLGTYLMGNEMPQGQSFRAFCGWSGEVSLGCAVTFRRRWAEPGLGRRRATRLHVGR